jgi:tRNA-intron endonuclease
MIKEVKNREANYKKEDKIPIKTILKENKVFVRFKKDIEGFSSRGYGLSEDKKFILTFCEALYLLGKKDIKINDETSKKKVSFKELLGKARSIEKGTWVRYLIYRDLRNRGYIVREGFGLGIDFRVYKRGEYNKSTANYLILGLREGQPIGIEDLVQVLKRVQILKKTLILAVLNRRGEIVYYSLSQRSFN